MPTYEYLCKDCGNQLDVVQSFSDDALTTCAQCGGTLRKLFGNVGISFKGSGFYKNDSRGKAKTPTPASNGDTSGGSSSSDSTKKTEPSTSQPSDSGSKPSDSGSKPSDSGSKPSDSGSKPSDSGSKPSKSGSKPT
ncbi:MAG: FmdB family transcriptional regulator [Acidimicrobiia bacterium]|nr:FmdB family transcriptional regulator [Acidimicrobiia bacterium]